MSKQNDRYGDLFEKFEQSRQKETEYYSNLYQALGQPAPNTGKYELWEQEQARKKYGDIINYKPEKSYDALLKYKGEKLSISAAIISITTIKIEIQRLTEDGSYASLQAIANIKRSFPEYIERFIWDKVFATCVFDGKFSAFIFNNEDEGKELTSANPQTEFKSDDFSEFKKATENWGDPDNYSCGDNFLTFCDKQGNTV